MPNDSTTKSHFSLPPPEAMNLKTGNMADNWKYFEEDWKNWSTATKLSKEEDAIQIAALRHVLGRETRDIADNLEIADRTKPSNVLAALKEHFTPKKNVTYERYVFNTTLQNEDTFDVYLNKLRSLAATCEFGNLKDSLIRDRLVVGVRNNATREKLLEMDNPDLESCVKMCRAIERTQQQLKKMDGAQAEVHALGRGRHKSGKQEKKACKYCGSTHEKGKCPAYGKKCSNCDKWHHFSSVCKQKFPTEPKRTQKSGKGHSKGDWKRNRTYQSHHVDAEEEESEDDIYSDTYQVRKSKSKTKYMVLPKFKLPYQTDYTEIPIQIDNGSEVNCMRKQDLLQLDPHAKLSGTSTKLRAYGNSTVTPLGTADIDIKINGEQRRAEFVIIQEASSSLLSGNLSEDLGLITVKRELLVNQVTKSPLTKDEIVKQYEDVFQGLGRIGEYRIELKEDAKPTQDAPRTVPVALRTELKQRLDDMEKDGILEKVEEPTDWVNSAVYVKRPNKKLRVCLDPRILNNSVKIPKYRMPTLEDITPELSKVRVFSVCDAKDGFLQIELDKESSFLTTFHTPYGRYCWKRLPFGICSAPEVFQRRVLEIIEGLPGVYAIADDCLIVGQGETTEEATADHDKNFVNFLERCKEANLKLNLSKLKFRLDSVKYHGHILTKEGLCPDEEKVEAITNMPRPKDKSETRRLLGMITYLSKFIPQLSSITQPLRDLTKQDNQFLWSNHHEETYNRLKNLLANAPCLKYFDIEDECVLETDASDYGLGAVITQQGKPIAYASRTLTETERRYSQLEKECLALVFGCQRFDQYLLGNNNITAYTDHKPLEVILRKSINAAPKRVQRMMLRLQRYRLNVVYKKGAQMHISDHLSRSPLARKENKGTTEWEIFTLRKEEALYTDISEIHADLYHNVRDATLRKVMKATAEDTQLQKLSNAIAHGFPEDKTALDSEIRLYWPYRDELSIENGVIYRGVRVLIPPVLRPEMLCKIHSSHLGVEATIRKARDSIYWPSIHNDIKDMCQRCEACQTHQPANTREPMKSQPIPQRQWQICSTDLFTVKGTEYLLVVDNLTKYWEVEQLPELTAEEIIQKTKEIFARQGIPEVLISDNGAQYTAKEFKAFAADWGFQHHTSSPHHSQGNGTAEAAVKVVKMMFKKAADPYLAILEHRNTPDTTGYSSSQKLNSRRIRSTVPVKAELLTPSPVPIDKIVNAQVESKQRNKEYYDRKAKPLPRLEVGNYIRAKLHPKSSKEWQPAQVTAAHGNSYNIVSGNREYRRNRIHLRSSTAPSVIAGNKQIEMAAAPENAKKAPIPSQTREVEIEPGTSSSHNEANTAPSCSTIQSPANQSTAAASNSMQPPANLRRSERTVKQPSYLKDYRK